MKKRAYQFALLICLVCVCISCQRHSSRVIGDLQGGSLPDAARKDLKSLGFDSGWTEEVRTNPDDHFRPRHDFITMKGPFSDLGITGQLELIFYNGRLMEAQFRPSESERYFKLLSEHLVSASGSNVAARVVSSSFTMPYEIWKQGKSQKG